MADLWLHVDHDMPYEGQEVWYAWNGGVYAGKYNTDSTSLPGEHLQIFQGKYGWLTNDVIYWMPKTDKRPLYPNVKVYD